MEKLTQVSSSTSANPNFLILDGVMHDLPEWKQSGGHGTVSGVSNIAPSSTVRLWELCCRDNRSSDEEKELQEVLHVLSKVDAVVMPLGVRGLSMYKDSRLVGTHADSSSEYVLGYLHGYGKRPRRPLLELDEVNGKAVTDLLEDLLKLEKRYGEETAASRS